MKMKYMVLGAWCMALGVSTAWAEMPVANSVVGYWRFNDGANRGFDSTGHGNAITALGSGTSYVASGSYDGSGYLNISTGGKTSSGTLVSAFDGSKGYTVASWFKSTVSINGFTMMLITDPNDKALANLINNPGVWNFAAMRHEPGKKMNASKTYTIAGNPAYDDGNGGPDDRAESSDTSAPKFPLSVSGASVLLGGKLGLSSASWDYKGTMDDAMLIDRPLSKREMTRLYQTGEAYVYLRFSAVAFASADGWSTEEADYKPSPADLPTADYIVDSGRTLTASASGIFGGHSLTLGRDNPLVSVLDGSTVATTKGNLTQTASVIIGDLRLNDGKLTASAGTTLTATKLTVNATEANPFEVSVASETCVIAGTATGGGWIEKTGSGTLDLSGLRGDYNVKVSAGEVIYPAEYYDSGTKPMLIWQ